MERYAVIENKNKREIVLLRGSGCAYKKCAFCDYHTDGGGDEKENVGINVAVLSRVTGKYGALEVINSGSVFELDENTVANIRATCKAKGISTLHFESHYMYESRIPALRRSFDGIALKLKLGLETFDYALREGVLKKGIKERDPARIAKNFDEANFLFGISGQTAKSMRADIELGLELFERICVNIMCENTTSIKPDAAVIDEFMREVYPLYKNDERVDILINNTDFGVG